MKMIEKRLSKAFYYALFSPIIVVWVFLSPVLFFGLISCKETFLSCFYEMGVSIFSFIIVSFLSIPISALIIVSVGLPLYFIFKKYKISSLTSYLGAGLFLGFIFFLLVYKIFFLLFLIPPACPLATLVFWLIARPDKYGYDD